MSPTGTDIQEQEFWKDPEVFVLGKCSRPAWQCGGLISVSSSGFVAGAQPCASKCTDAGRAFSHCITTASNVVYTEAPGQEGAVEEKLPSLFPISLGLVQGCSL